MQANAGVFARIMQLMGAQGSSLNSLAVAVKGKLQGLFTGIAAGVAPTVLKIMEASSTGGMNLAAAIRQFSPSLEPLAKLVESLVNMDLAGVGMQLGAGAAAIAEAIMNGDAIAYIKNGLTIAAADFRALLTGATASISEAFTKFKEYLDIPSIIAQMRTGMESAATSFVGILQKGAASMLQSLRNSSDFLQRAISPETVLALANQGAKASKEAAAALKGLFAGGGGIDLGATLGISQAEQVAADEARKRNEEIEARSRKTAAQTADEIRKKFATPEVTKQELTKPTNAVTQPIGAIVSSMAKIGGDVGFQNVGVLDIQRQQLQAQQRTADNTARLVAQMKPQVVPTSTVVYQ
jgi:hypothetical protein